MNTNTKHELRRIVSLLLRKKVRGVPATPGRCFDPLCTCGMDPTNGWPWLSASMAARIDGAPSAAGGRALEVADVRDAVLVDGSAVLWGGLAELAIADDVLEWRVGGVLGGVE